MGGAYAGAAAAVALPGPLPSEVAPSGTQTSYGPARSLMACPMPVAAGKRTAPTVRTAETAVSGGVGGGLAAAAAAVLAMLPQRRRREGLIARQSGTSSRQYAESNNRGVDPKRLLGALRGAGLTKKSPSEANQADDDSSRRALLVTKGRKAGLTPANGRGAALLVREERRLALEQGRAAIRPAAQRRDYRLPLLVKYNKPPGVAATMRNLRAKGVEDLRATVSRAGDRFELDLYHPVGSLPTKSSGLLLWSRSGQLTKHLTSTKRGVVHEFEVEVMGAVNEETLQEALRSGVTLGFAGFEYKKHADLVEVEYLPDSSLQDPRSRIVVRTIDGRTEIPKMLRACGHRVVTIKRTRVGAVSLGSLPDGELEEATPEEEAWVCGLADMPADEYPMGFLPPERSPRAEAVTDDWMDEDEDALMLLDEEDEDEMDEDRLSEDEEELSVWEQHGVFQN